MNRTPAAALALLALAGTSLATPHETHTFAGPYGVLGETNWRNTTLTATFTATDSGVPYTANGLYLVADLTSNSFFTYANETVIRVTPPAGPVFEVRVSDEYIYETIQDGVADVRLPAGITPVGQWTFYIYQEYEFDGAVPDAYISNIRISLQDLPLVDPPEPVTDLGVLTGDDLTATVPDYSGADIFWYTFTSPQAVDAANGFYVDIDTFGSDFAAGATSPANDTMIGLFDAVGTLRASNDDVYDGEQLLPESWLSFGSTTPRGHGANPAEFTGRNGTLLAGTYYLAAGAYFIEFDDGFFAGMDSTTTGGPKLQVNIYSRFTTTPVTCSEADLGESGGVRGSDNALDNNDFIAFITLFFAADATADMGIAGGAPGQDGAWDNNDFIAFINYFFDDQAACTG